LAIDNRHFRTIKRNYNHLRGKIQVSGTLETLRKASLRGPDTEAGSSEKKGLKRRLGIISPQSRITQATPRLRGTEKFEPQNTTPSKEDLVGRKVSVYEEGEHPWDEQFRLTTKEEEIAEVRMQL